MYRENLDADSLAYVSSQCWKQNSNDGKWDRCDTQEMTDDR